ncbi:MAG: GNAT family N-acetyltransferase [Chitinophagales bacterium]|nr:GNAT family N-acetyltransferase [Chitinophagales bacterium]
MQIQFRLISLPSSEYDQSLELRDRVLRIPLGLSLFDEDLEQEKQHIHIAGFDNDTLIAILILQQEPPKAKMRQVAVEEKYQGKGIGKELVHFAEKWLQKNEYTEVYCNARDVALPFYESLDYEVEGNPFTEVGIIHYRMKKKLI